MSERDKKSTKGEMNLHSGHRQRLRQAYVQRGADGMFDHQLLELLLTYALPRIDTNGLAHRLLGREGFGSLGGVLRADVHQLAKTPGIGESAAILISLVGALSRKASLEQVKGQRLNTPEAAMRYCIAMAGESSNESLYMVSLDGSRKVLHTDSVSTGIPGETVVYPRTVVELALKRGAENVILFHNHPTGNLRPSKEDFETTRRIIEALSPIGITLNDHIITGGGNAFSMVRGSELIDEAEQRRDTLAAVAERKE